MYTRFPYNISRDGGWRDETADCRSNGTVLAGNRSAHESDWDAARETTAWIRGRRGEEAPFFAYQGMTIVHPPYATSQEWYDKVDPSKIDVPAWPDLGWFGLVLGTRVSERSGVLSKNDD